MRVFSKHSLLIALPVAYLSLAFSKPSSQQDTPHAMNQNAESYVKLVLAVGQHDPDYVDAYYGPTAWQEEAKSKKKSLNEIRTEAEALLFALDSVVVSTSDEMVQLRRIYLGKQLGALIARVDLLRGTKTTFDEEAKATYDAAPPTYPEKHFKDILARLEALLPGDGPIAKRYERFKQAFIIPKEKLDTVFTTAIMEARRRTIQHISLPSHESFKIEYVTDKSWSGYNWFKGNGHSLIQINTDLPIYIDRAIDLACHEGYPGHHVYNVLLEENLFKKRGWIEFSIYALFSPQSLIAEGSANYGIDVAFPGHERVEYESTVLFPLAGIDASKADLYYQIAALVEQLNYAGNEAARQYLDGKIDREQAAQWLQTYALMSPDRAKQRVRFIDQYRSYVINYNLGQDLVKRYIESRRGAADHPEKRWEEFGKLISSPRLPSGLK